MLDGPSNSIVWSLKRLFDTPAEVEREEREQAATMRGQDQADGDPPTFRCRVCGREGPEARYCLDCLAETMVPAKPAR